MSKIIGIMGKAGSGKDTVADFLVFNCGFVKMSLADEMKRFTKKVFGFSDEQLWGPSRYRNAVDERYNDPDRWGLAEDNLMNYGRAWAKFLFAPDMANANYWRLLGWFERLYLDRSIEFGENKLSPRVVLQTIGTEYGRAIDNDVWIRSTLDIAKKVLSDDYTYTREDGLTPIAPGPSRLTQVRGIVIPDCRFRNEVEGVQAAGGRIIRIKRLCADKQTIGIAGHASEAEQDTIPDNACDHVLDAPEGLANLGVVLTSFLPNIVRGL